MRKAGWVLAVLAIMATEAFAQEASVICDRDEYGFPVLPAAKDPGFGLTVAWKDGESESTVESDPFTRLTDLKILDNPAFHFEAESRHISIKLYGTLDLAVADGTLEISVVVAINLRPSDLLGSHSFLPLDASDLRTGHEIDIELRYLLGSRFALSVGFAGLIGSDLTASGTDVMAWVGFELRS